MMFTVYSSFKNIDDFNKGIPIQCFPERQNIHDIAMHFKVNEVSIMSNQSGIYISKKVKKSLFKKLFMKKRS